MADAGRLVHVLPPVLGRLGLDEDAPRLRTAHAAQDLVRRLSVLGGVELVRTLGTMRLDPQPEVIARSLTTVDTVVTAIEAMTWKLVAKARHDAAGDEVARALVKALADAVAANEFSVALAPATKHVNDGLVDWIAGGDDPTPEPDPDPPIIDSGGVELPDPDDPDRKEQVFTVVNRVGAETLVQQLQTFIDSHADRSIEVRWRLT